MFRLRSSQLKGANPGYDFCFSSFRCSVFAPKYLEKRQRQCEARDQVTGLGRGSQRKTVKGWKGIEVNTILKVEDKNLRDN